MLAAIKKKLLYSLYRQNWNIGVIRQPVSVVAGLQGRMLQNRALDAIQWMEESRGTFKADPFPAPNVDDSSKLLIFYEHFDWRTKIGIINVVDCDEEGFSQPRLALDSSYHLSYPFILMTEREGAYLIPEHSEARDVSRFTFNSAGKIINKKTIIPRRELVDSTIVRHSGKYWLFATLGGPKVNSDLQIYYSDDLIEWYMHPCNPVKSDLTNARPAGQFFRYKGALFRPAQNCSSYYGESITVNRVIELSETKFVEAPETELRPSRASPYSFGLHTLSHLDSISVIDGARLESKLTPALDKFSPYLLVG